MRIIADPIQLRRQINAFRKAMQATCADPDETDQNKTTARVGFHVFPTLIGTLGGELYNDANPRLLAGAFTELIGKTAAAVVETLFEDKDHDKALFDLMGAAHVIAATEIKARQNQKDEQQS